MGTGAFAVPPLAALISGNHEVIAVVSQPDRPRGRGLKTEPTPVKNLAAKAGLKVWQPETLKDEAARDKMLKLSPDLVVVAAYGKILPGWVMADPPLGAINIHGSLLPDYRGAAPIQRAVINGADRTGVTILKVEAEVDTGDILLTAATDIEADETFGELSARLSAIGAGLINEAVAIIESGRADWQAQTEDATYAPKIDKTEAKVDWTRDAITLKNLARGLNPNPGAFFLKQGQRVKLWRAAALPGSNGPKPGEISEILPAGPVVACGDGALLLTELQPAGKSPMTGAEFARGYRPCPGDMLE
jgi:methionyl-tRNA formyltransferase